MKRRTLILALPATLAAHQAAGNRKVLVYTRNYTPDGKGFVHDNIQTSVEAIRKLGSENGFEVGASDDPGVFTAGNLKQYKALIFSNTNNEAFANDSQREAFRQYIRSGGGFVGIHSATGSERNWPYYWSVIGGKFARHPALQKFTIAVKDPNHPSTRGLPATFEWEDECYMHEFLNPELHPLLVTAPSKLNDPAGAKHPLELLGDRLPLAWTLHMDGGRQFYTALGHKKSHYSDPILVKHITGGILWAMETA